MKKQVLTTLLLPLLLSGATSFAAIIGTAGACIGGTSTLYSTTDSTGAGTTWSSSNPSIASVAVLSGATAVVTGHAAGTATITFTGPSGTFTTPFTVSAPPTAIGGGASPICVGGTTTLTTSTTGGSWSSGTTWRATVDATTGVVTGVSGGTATISYSLVTTCAATRVVTVNAAPIPDTVFGPATICPGGTGTMSTATSGGTWSSSNPTVATVGAATGVVTGVSTGTAYISYTVSAAPCGSSTSVKLVTVSSTISAGPISGPATLTAGGAAYYYGAVSGGTWSSSNPSVATVSSSGYVSAVAAGTTIISYTASASGCTPSTATFAVTVTTPSCITGTVNFTGTAPTGAVKVLLIRYNPSTTMLYAVDSQYLYPSGGWNYSFCGLGTDSFRVKAFVDSLLPGTGHQPTYHNASAYWNTANVIYHTAGTTDAGKNINMGYGTVTSGPGFIGGSVTTGANKGTADAVPAVGMLVYCVNNSTGAIMQQAITNSTGNYTFSGLPTGVAMSIYPEAINYATTPYPTVTLTSSASSVTAANFKQSTLYRTIVPITSSVADVANTDGLLSVYPNPATNAVTIQWANLANAGTTDITITDVTGRVVLATTADMNATTGNLKVNIGQLAKGLYVLHVRGNGLNVTRKLEVE